MPQILALLEETHPLNSRVRGRTLLQLTSLGPVASDRQNKIKIGIGCKRLEQIFQAGVVRVGSEVANAGDSIGWRSLHTIQQAIRLRTSMEHFLQQDMHTGQDVGATRHEVQTLMSV